MSTPQKETVYIDIDDEITSIIEKVHDSKSKILALVLPKRAAVLQSTVNMRLLKRASEEAKKNIVLITSESAILPLAGAVGLHVAKTLQSQPAIPPAPELKPATLTINDEADTLDTIDPKTPIGKLAGSEAAAEAEETIDVDYADKEEDDKKPDKKTKGDKKLKVPNFERFRLWILLGGALLILLIIGAIWAFIIAPKAKITIKTDTSTIGSNLDLTASPNAKSLDIGKRIVPVTTVQIQKTDTQSVSATGQQDTGNKATGNVTLSLTDCSQSQVTVPSGTVVSASNANFVTQAAATLSSVIIGGACKNSSFPDVSSGTVAVTAQNAGDKYNLSARSYSVNGFSNVSGSGTAMTGGTSNLVKVLSQDDFNTAKQQLLDRTKAAASTDLAKQLSSNGQFALTDSITLGDQSITAAPDIGAQTAQSTVTAKLTYTMTGMAQSDLKQLIEADVKQKIDPKTQQIQDQDDGLSKASIKLSDKKSNGDIPVNLQVQVTAGPQLDTVGITKEVAGKKRGDTLAIIEQRPGVKDVTIQYSPFWVSSTPKKTGKITVVFVKADGSQ